MVLFIKVRTIRNHTFHSADMTVAPRETQEGIDKMISMLQDHNELYTSLQAQNAVQQLKIVSYSVCCSAIFHNYKIGNKNMTFNNDPIAKYTLFLKYQPCN